ncbi:ArsC family reductase [Vibrio cincinnatiensis]|uniref:ArsC family reductase n=1 Tax=Vibrio cincinnatiensis TaxID=675 RepID=UPI001EE098F3|nr:ArsC family reductase [Vibrio cincinnatiensis]MCG3730900.1 ArsC family reductase [Vibrio cincinnatiensis]
MLITLYGIPNCDTIKKARKWLEAQAIEYQFHDYRKNGITPELVNEFFQSLGWENVLNKRGTTYRQLSQEQKESLNETHALALLLEQPAMIKRPILRVQDTLYLGFSAQQYSELFS